MLLIMESTDNSEKHLAAIPQFGNESEQGRKRECFLIMLVTSCSKFQQPRYGENIHKALRKGRCLSLADGNRY